MIWLVAASLIWAFAFGLIKRFLPGLDPLSIAAVRLGLAALVFMPWTIAGSRTIAGLRLRAMRLGMVQFGAMYVCYLAAFSYLAAWQVALWTVLTPLYVALLGAWRDRQNALWPLLAALLAVAGALVAEGRLPQGASLRGVLLIQASNLCFAAGQLGFRPLAAAAMAAPGRRIGEAGLLGWMYLGAAVLVIGAVVLMPDRSAIRPTGSGAAVLLYLGVVSTAVAFWFWNKGAARTETGRLAAANNLKVPLAVFAAWLVFQETVPVLRAAAGLVVILLAVRLAARRKSGQVPRT